MQFTKRIKLRNLARVFAVCVIDFMREVIKEAKDITFKVFNTRRTIYGVLLVLA